MIVYKTINLVNGKIYVGQDFYNNPNYFGSGLLIQAAIKKYGIENFKKEIIEYCSNTEKLDEREIYWIEKLKSRDKNIGYNLSAGGHGMTCDIIEKIRKKRKEQKNYGKWSDEKKKIQSERWIDKWKDPDYREKHHKSTLGCQKGKQVSDDTKSKMKAARNKHCVNIKAIHKITGEILEFDKMIKASESLNIPYHNFERVSKNHLTYEITIIKNDYIFVNKKRPLCTYVFYNNGIEIEKINGTNNAIKFAKLQRIPIKYVRYKELRETQTYNGWKIEKLNERQKKDSGT